MTRRVAIVTGSGTGGIGAASVRGLLADDWAVVVSDHADQQAGIDALVAEVGDSERAVAYAADVTSEEGVDALVAHAVATYGAVDGLVNSAGAMLRKDIFTTSLEEWDRIIRINQTGTWLLNRAVGRVMRERGSGAIVNVASVYADRAGPLPESAYYASKAAVSNLTRGLAAEFGAFGVRVNCLAPGVFYPTAMTAPLANDPETLAGMTRRTMLGRLGDVEKDIDGVVRFLLSPDAGYITGQTIFVDGGWSAW